MLTFVTTRKTISTVCLTLLLCILLICTVVYKIGVARQLETLQPNATTREERVLFLKHLGYTARDDADEEQKAVEIPHVFSDVYRNYNALQGQAGYNLEQYGGKTVTLYTLPLLYGGRDDVYAHLLVYENCVIGGDIAAVSITDGFMKPLITEKK